MSVIGIVLELIIDLVVNSFFSSTAETRREKKNEEKSSDIIIGGHFEQHAVERDRNLPRAG